MKKKVIILGAIIIVSLIVSISATILTKSSNNSPPDGPITCHTIQENPGGINIVFFSIEDQATEYSDYFLSVAPYNNHPEKFNFYYISPEDYVPECERYQGIAILCYSREIVQAASACPNDYIVVLREEPSSIRSSAYRGVMSLNLNHPLTVFAHEFYHVFDNAAEEYSLPGASIPSKSENCQKACEDFREFPEHQGEFGCYQTCTESNYYREFENGFMRSLQADRYGLHNELILEEEIYNQFEGDISLSGFATQEDNPCDKQEYYLIEGEQKTLEKGCAQQGATFGPTAQIEYKLGETEEIQLPSNDLFITDYNPTPGAIITAESPQEVDLPLVVTIPSSGQEQSIIIPDSQGNPGLQISLIGIGAHPCKN
ncbi:MAG: hypothetical protein ABH864_00050 [archaeon]